MGEKILFFCSPQHQHQQNKLSNSKAFIIVLWYLKVSAGWTGRSDHKKGNFAIPSFGTNLYLTLGRVSTIPFPYSSEYARINFFHKSHNDTMETKGREIHTPTAFLCTGLRSSYPSMSWGMLLWRLSCMKQKDEAQKGSNINSSVIICWNILRGNFVSFRVAFCGQSSWSKQ